MACFWSLVVFYAELFTTGSAGIAACLNEYRIIVNSTGSNPPPKNKPAEKCVFPEQCFCSKLFSPALRGVRRKLTQMFLEVTSRPPVKAIFEFHVVEAIL